MALKHMLPVGHGDVTDAHSSTSGNKKLQKNIRKLHVILERLRLGKVNTDPHNDRVATLERTQEDIRSGSGCHRRHHDNDARR